MKKQIIITTLVCLCCCVSKAWSQQIGLQFDQAALMHGDTLRFSVWCNSSESLELYVLKQDTLLWQQNIQISYSEMPFTISTSSFPEGNYFILLTGNDVHIEKQFLLWKPE